MEIWQKYIFFCNTFFFGGKWGGNDKRMKGVRMKACGFNWQIKSLEYAYISCKHCHFSNKLHILSVKLKMSLSVENMYLFFCLHIKNAHRFFCDKKIVALFIYILQAKVYGVFYFKILQFSFIYCPRNGRILLTFKVLEFFSLCLFF